MLGEFVLPHGGSIWTATIIDGLAELGIGERNARQAAARLADQGLIESRRIGRSARWTLTPDGRRLLEDGTRRIYGFGGGPGGWDGSWLVVLASVPEGERAKRHHLRSRLGFGGFGFLAPGIAVSPHVDREGFANDVLRQLDLPAIVFVARTGTYAPDREIIERAWDLDGLARRYRAFVEEFEPGGSGEGRSAFASVVSLVHEWRRFPFDDPEIPAELLPARWPAPAAKAVFDARRSDWLDAATAWYRESEQRSTVT